MAYTYPAPNVRRETLFKQPADTYPTLHLPVALFTDEVISDSALRPYSGASDLANFVLWRALDHSSAARSAYDKGDLWLTADFNSPDWYTDIDVELQVGKDYARLRAGKGRYELAASWNKNEDGYHIHSLLDTATYLFGYDPAPLTVEQPAAYQQRPTHAEYLGNPALRFAYRFWQLETSVVRATQRDGFDQAFELDALSNYS